MISSAGGPEDMTLFDLEMIFFPINIDNSHWTLAVAACRRTQPGRTSAHE